MSGPRDDSLPFEFDLKQATFALNETEEALAQAFGVRLTEACQNLGHLKLKDSESNRTAMKTSMSGLIGALSLLASVASLRASPGLRCVMARANFAFAFIATDVDTIKS